MLLARNLPINAGVRQWSHTLMIPLHRLWTKSNNRTCGQFEYDMTWFCLCFLFICSYARFGCCSIVCLKEWGLEELVGGWEGWSLFNFWLPTCRRWNSFECWWTWGKRFWKLDNFDGRHICIVPKDLHRLRGCLYQNQAMIISETRENGMRHSQGNIFHINTSSRDEKSLVFIIFFCIYTVMLRINAPFF